MALKRTSSVSAGLVVVGKYYHLKWFCLRPSPFSLTRRATEVLRKWKSDDITCTQGREAITNNYQKVPKGDKKYQNVTKTPTITTMVHQQSKTQGVQLVIIIVPSEFAPPTLLLNPPTPGIMCTRYTRP